MRYPRLFNLALTSIWASTPETQHAVLSTLLNHVRGETVSLGVAKPATFEIVGGVAKVPIVGVIGKRLDSFETMCGGCDVNRIQSQILEAIDRDDVSEIVLDIDSPGGVITGVPETAALIKEANDIKPVFAYTDTMAASAAVWIASGARGFFAAESADVGSIGVYSALLDSTEAYKKAGYAIHVVRSGDLKAEGFPGTPITEELIKRVEADVKEAGDEFRAHIKATRSGITDEAMRGQVYSGRKAATSAYGLLDGTFPSIDHLIEQIIEERQVESRLI